MYFVIKKMQKVGFIYRRIAELTWRAGPARMQRGTKATWQGRAWPTHGTGGADTWQDATRVPADAREGRHMA